MSKHVDWGLVLRYAAAVGWSEELQDLADAFAAAASVVRSASIVAVSSSDLDSWRIICSTDHSNFQRGQMALKNVKRGHITRLRTYAFARSSDADYRDAPSKMRRLLVPINETRLVQAGRSRRFCNMEEVSVVNTQQKF